MTHCFLVQQTVAGWMPRKCELLALLHTFLCLLACKPKLSLAQCLKVSVHRLYCPTQQFHRISWCSLGKRFQHCKRKRSKLSSHATRKCAAKRHGFHGLRASTHVEAIWKPMLCHRLSQSFQAEQDKNMLQVVFRTCMQFCLKHKDLCPSHEDILNVSSSNLLRPDFFLCTRHLEWKESNAL